MVHKFQNKVSLTFEQHFRMQFANIVSLVSFEEFKEYWKAASKDHYFANSVTIEFPHETESELQCKYTECLFAKTFRDLGAADLGKILVCDPDFTFAQTLSPHLYLERTKTLMEGHDCCDHRYYWKD
ncbi:MAG: L-2-amino-thiazoline-4-carboxylic acid hydrolase [Candidatus Thorarchaeota archaeon]|jgi:hypothetical protein